MDDKLVTAIILTHNRLDLLKKAIISVKNQSYEKIEIIVIDNFSDDGTSDYLAKESNIMVLTEKNFVNGNVARNHGIQYANGEYIAFLDDDDEWAPEKIEKQVELLKSSPDVGVVYTGMKKRFDSGLKSIELPSGEYIGDIHEKVFLAMFATSSSLIIKKDLLLKTAFDEKLTHWQDYELLVSLSEFTLFDAINEPLTIINVNKSSSERLSNQFIKWIDATTYFYQKHDKRIKLLNAHQKKIVQLNYLNDAITRLDGKKGAYLLRIKYLAKKIKITRNLKPIVYMVPGITFATIWNLKKFKNILKWGK